MTPFKVLYGHDPPHLLHFGSSSTPVLSIKKYLEERDRVLEELKRHLMRAQQRNTQMGIGRTSNLK